MHSRPCALPSTAAFFEIGMVTRNERNAIIQHGTMTLVRRSACWKLVGWGEWCITEDAELGLRIFEAGYEAMYLPRSYGRGLMPDTFIDYKKQRSAGPTARCRSASSHARLVQQSWVAPDQRPALSLPGWMAALGGGRLQSGVQLCRDCMDHCDDPVTGHRSTRR
jgi:hypothetical protein